MVFTIKVIVLALDVIIVVNSKRSLSIFFSRTSRLSLYLLLFPLHTVISYFHHIPATIFYLKSNEIYK